MDKTPKVSALQIGRGGSVGFPGKNIYPVLGRPLMEYPLIAAINSNFIDEIVVSTDSKEIADIARKYNAVVMDRSPELASSTALGQDVYLDVYNRYLKERNVDIIVILGCNAPTVTAELIDESISVLRGNESLDSAVSVSQYDMWSPIRAKKLSSDGLLVPFIPQEFFDAPALKTSDRKALGPVLFADGSFFSIRPRCLENLEDGIPPFKWMGQRSYPIHNWGGCDVDYVWQIPFVEYWLKEHGFSESTTPYMKKK